MGEVHQALDRQTGLLVAVKVLHSRGMIEMARFNQEARVLSELSHPGIVRYFDQGVTPAGAPYIAMEWLEGETLEDRLVRGRLGPEDAARMAHRVLDALSAAHGRDIVHRDIKPGNIFLVGRKIGDIRVLDFGIARRRFDIKRFTRDGATVGTPYYTSPEQARGRGDVDGRADIFSLGCLVYEALAGEPPYTGESPLEVMTKICAGGAAELVSKRSGVPRALSSLVGSMLAPDPAHRPQSAALLAEEFAQIARSLQGAGAASAVDRHGDSDERQRRTAVAMLVSLGKRGKIEESARISEARRLIEHMECRMERLVDRKLLITTDAATPGEQAVRLAAVALALRELEPSAKLAVATGRATFVGSLPMGPFMDRLQALVSGQDGGSIRLDDGLPCLLPARFSIRTSQDRQFLETAPKAQDGDRRGAAEPEAKPTSHRSRRPSLAE